MERLMDGKQKKAVDSYSIEVMGVPALQLMEEAAVRVSEHVMELASREDRILAVCGSGNNGGDGIAAARILTGMGYETDVLFIGNPEKRTEQVKVQMQLAEECGVHILNKADIGEYNIVIDAIFGIGLQREVTGLYEEWIRQINQAQALTVAVDIPSGIQSGTGKVLGTAVKAEYTVTFGVNLMGLMLYPGCEYAGRVWVEDIGFPQEALDSVASPAFYYTKQDLQRMPERKAYSNKGTYGRVLVAAGSRTVCGACYLAAKAAYKMGAGLVKILTHEVNRTALSVLLPEALIATYEEEQVKRDPMSLKREFDWATAVVIGPGIGLEETGARLLELALAQPDKPVVVDADGVRLLGRRGGKVPAQVILTPHLKEMADFFGTRTADIAEDLTGTARLFASLNDGVLVLKDARTLAVQGRRLYVNASGNNGMATGGSGDVLSGIIGGLLAQGMNCFEAACLGAYLHGLAGDAAAEKNTVYSLMASDIIEGIPEVLQELTGKKA